MITAQKHMPGTKSCKCGGTAWTQAARQGIEMPKDYVPITIWVSLMAVVAYVVYLIIYLPQIME